MGGFGSGRTGGRPTADASRRIDIAQMIRTGKAKEGSVLGGSIGWSRGGEPWGSISYCADMREPNNSSLQLSYRSGEGDCKETVEQQVPLTFTEPNYGGKRWWMICPYRGYRVGQLYMPAGSARFASRKAWQLGYQSQRIAASDRAMEAYHRLEAKLGCERSGSGWITRPKGMHHRTFQRHLDELEYLDNLCVAELIAKFGLLDRKRP